MSTNTRRDFLKTCATAGTSAALLGAGQAKGAEGDKPDLIYIFTDQQSATMMSCTGNTWLKTPAMDYLSDNGIRFERAYTTNPVCVPARIGMMTGRFPGEFSSGRGKLERK